MSCLKWRWLICSGYEHNSFETADDLRVLEVRFNLNSVLLINDDTMNVILINK